ncbi:hypothetical protein PC120_g25372, partial [Phytophthora cactorum]
DELPVTHARFTTRFQCSLDDMNDILPKWGRSAWPLISTPPNWSRSQRDAAYTEVLQEFEKDASNGKREDCYMMVIADTKANALSRAAEEPLNDVNWL